MVHSVEHTRPMRVPTDNLNCEQNVHLSHTSSNTGNMNGNSQFGIGDFQDPFRFRQASNVAHMHKQLCQLVSTMCTLDNN